MRQQIVWRLVRLGILALLLIGVVALARVVFGAIPSLRERALTERIRTGHASPPELVREGEQLLTQGKALRAAELAFQARKADPHLATAHNLLGAVYGQAGQADRARECFERAAELDPQLLQPRLNLARIALAQQDGLRALKYLEPAREHHPNDATVWLLTGQIYRMLERSATAHHAFRKAVELDPTLAEAHVELGLLHIAFDRPALAVAPLEEAFRLGDHRPATRGSLALALTTGRARTADLERARTLLAEGGGPSTSFGWLAQALVLQHDGDYPAARRALARVLELDPKQERALYTIAETYRRQGDRPHALEAMERFNQVVKERQSLLTLATRIRERGATPARLKEYGEALLGAGRPAEALTQFRTWQGLEPSSPAAAASVQRTLARLKAHGAVR